LYALWRNGAKLVRRDVSSTIEYIDNPIKLPKGRKSQISRAKREGVTVEISTDFEAFIELENQVLAQYHGLKAVHTGQELELLHSRFPQEILLYVAKHDGKIEAGAVLFVYANMVHTQYMAGSEYSRKNGALDLLLATLIDKFSKEKKFFDFGISTEDEGNILNIGLTAQKEGFGGRSIVYDFYELKV
jgi:hypothetical protein